MEKIKVVIIGVGIRGRYTYGNYFEKNKNLYEVVAVVENKIGRRNKFQEIFNLPQNRVFENLDDFFKVEKIAHAVIISSIDNTHYDAAVKSLKKGYNVLVEGPVANSLDKLVNLENICEENKDRDIWSYFEIKTEEVISQDNIKKMKSYLKDIVEIKPIITSEYEENNIDVKEKSMAQLFNDFYKFKEKCEPRGELMDLFLNIVSEEGEDDETN